MTEQAQPGIHSDRGDARPLHAWRWGDVVAATPGTDAGGGAFALSAGSPNQQFVIPDDRPFVEIYSDADVHVYAADAAANLGSAAGERRRVAAFTRASRPARGGDPGPGQHAGLPRRRDPNQPHRRRRRRRSLLRRLTPRKIKP